MTSNSNKTTSNNGVVLHGYHTKLKTMRKKYFVLYEDCGKSLARLEYFDKEKQFKTKTKPKRTILLNSCFNINRRLDTKHEFVVTLSTKDESFGIVMETEDEMNKWLKAMLKLQSGLNILQGQPKPFYEHVWQVVVQKKGLADKKGILGSYHVCLSSKSVTLIRIGPERTDLDEPRVPVVEFYLTSIRRCGDSKRYFYMEVGRHSVIGAGELWMETKDSLIAQNMHTMILNVMSSNAEDSYGPMRKRSSSATETSKPVTILQRRQTHSGSKTLNSSPLSAMNRDRCDSLPSRNRTTTESSTNSFGNASMPPSRTMSSLNTVPNSNYNRHSHSPPMNSNALSPSMGCSESDGSTLSIDEPDSMKNSLTPDDNASFISRFYNSRSPGGVIPEENVDEFWYTENKKLNCYNIDNVDIHPNDGRKTLSSSSNIHSEETESQYVDMSTSKSPCENALCDNSLVSGYMKYRCDDSSDGNSRTSSIAEETVDGYVHMSSPQTSDYVDMEQAMKNRRQVYNAFGITPARMANMYFEEYPLEKISTGIFTDDDESQVLKDRPPRAYSVGSRIEHNNQRLPIEVANSDQNNSRVRAFSVGSRSKVPRCDLQRNILMAAAHSAASNNSNVNNSKSSVASIEPSSESTGRGRKSSSAPLLIHKSQNSVDRMDDLMEIDFSKNSTSRSNSLSSQSPGASSLHLPKGSHLRSKLSSSPGQSVVSNRSHDSFSEIPQQTVDNGYLEMRPVIYSTNQNNFNESVEHLSVPNDSSNIDLPEMPQQQQDATHNKFKMDEWKVETPEGYLEMSWNGNKNSSYSNIDQILTNSKHLLNDIANASIKSRSMMNDLKKSRAVSKMPSSNTSQILKNNRGLGAGNVSKLSALHTQNQAMQQRAAGNLPNKSESNLRKRFFDHVNNSFTISEEKTTGTEQDTNLYDKLQDLIIQSKYIDDETSNKVDTSPVDNECPASIDFSVDPTKQASTPKKNQVDVVEREKIRDVDCKMSTSDQSVDTICGSHSKDESVDNERKPISSSNADDSSSEDGSKLAARKSNSPKCTPTSPFSSSSRCHRHSNPNRQAKGTGYELLHICSDSSLQTRKNLSRPSSVNSDRVFTPDTLSSRPSSVNSDCVQMNSSSTATLCFSSSNACDNREQDQALKSALVSNNAFNDDNKLKSIECISSTKHIAANDLTNSPGSKTTGPCQNMQNPELELNYASLDLPKNSNSTIHGSVSNQTRSSTSDDTSVSLSPNSNTSQQSTFTYAKIDFNQCDSKKFKCGGTQNNL